jgi:DNA polymerase
VATEARTLEDLREAAAGCQACELWKLGTQTVFGEGPSDARLMLVGEQPGDREDLEGRPFVGPAGRLLDKALADAGIDRAAIYATNAVKHFKWKPKGKRRIHDTPNEREIVACHPWVEAEIALVRPRMIVCLGATAARALLGKGFRVTRQRGEIIERPPDGWITATVHPSSLLRLRDDAARHAAYEALVEDLAGAARRL